MQKLKLRHSLVFILITWNYNYYFLEISGLPNISLPTLYNYCLYLKLISCKTKGQFISLVSCFLAIQILYSTVHCGGYVKTQFITFIWRHSQDYLKLYIVRLWFIFNNIMYQVIYLNIFQMKIYSPNPHHMKFGIKAIFNVYRTDGVCQTNFLKMKKNKTCI